MKPAGEPIFRRRPNRSGRNLVFGLLLALLVHGGFTGLVALIAALGWMGGDDAPFTPPAPVALVNLPASDWEQNRQVGPRPPPTVAPSPAQPPPPTPPEEKKETVPKGQVVDVAPGNDQKPPDDAKYLAEHNNKVEKESKSKDQTAFYKNAQPKRTTTTPPSEATGHDAVAKAQKAGNEGSGEDDLEKQVGKQSGHLDVPSAEKHDKVALLQNGPNGEVKNQEESQALKGNSKQLNIAPGPLGGPEEKSASEGRAGQRNVANLMPSAATMDKIAGAAANDHLDDVDEGDGTFLNTREWKYATFFNRVKQSVGEHWDPSAPLRSRDPEGKIYAFKDRYTMLSVTLDTSGRIKAVSVEKSSGVDFLDDEAVAAFERSQPFPNPPPGLVEHGQVRFSFGFFLEVNSPTPFKIFRSRD